MARVLDRISYVDDGVKKPYTYYPVVIIGAGESGICMGARLRQVLGFDQFRIFDRRGALGGTWYTNTYPGIACDVPAILYSFSFAQKSTWAAPYPPGSEIRKYLEEVAGRFKLLDKIQYDTSVKQVRWIDTDEEWEIDLEYLAPGVGDMATLERQALEKEKGVEFTVLKSETVRAKIVASAVGGLVEPKPNIRVPGFETFEGKIVHTARWDNSLDLRGKDVVVVGTGCSGAQVVASLVKPEYGVKSLTQLLRSPPWVVPALSKDTFDGWMKTFRTYVPYGQNLLRKIGFTAVEHDFISHFPNTKRAQKGRQETAKRLLRYMRKNVPEQFHDILTPNYEVFCKRRVIDDGWFASLRDARSEITSQPLTAISPTSITLGPGRHYPPMEVKSNARTDQREIPCDVLVMANGFTTNEYLHPLDVHGRGGVSLHDLWKQRGGAQAYLGLCMDQFPNFFMIFGPNTATGHSSVILATENMVNLTLKLIKPVLKGEVKTVEVHEHAEKQWTARIQAALKDCVFNSGGCRNWYLDENGTGWNSTVYPFTQVHHTIRCMFPRWRDWNLEYTTKGLVKLWTSRILKTLLVVALLGVANFVRIRGWTTTKAIVSQTYMLTSMLAKNKLRALLDDD